MPRFTVHRSHSRCAIMCLLLVGLLSACTYEHSRQKAHGFLREADVVTNHRINRSADWVLSSATHVCLVRPHHAESPRAYHQLTQALHLALQQNFAVVEVTQAVQDLRATALVSGAQGCAVMLVPRILKADDQLNSWAEVGSDYGVFPDRSPGRDRLTVQVSVFDVAAARPLDTAIVQSATGWWTRHAREPNGMFEAAMREYVARISGRPHTS